MVKYEIVDLLIVAIIGREGLRNAFKNASLEKTLCLK